MASYIGRRKFLATLGAAAAWPLAARAQQRSGVPAVAFISAASRNPSLIEAFERGLREQGRIPEQTIRIVERYARGDLNLMRDQISEVLGEGASVFVTAGANATRAIQELSNTASIVVANLDSFEAAGVTSINRPPGNVTGFATLGSELVLKRLEFLREMITDLQRVIILWNPSNATHPLYLAAIKKAPESLRFDLRPLPVAASTDLEAALRIERAAGAQAVIAFRDFTFETKRAEIVHAVMAAGLPSAFDERMFVDLGGLMSYSPSHRDLFRRSAEYVVKIIDGAKPTHLPIQLPTKFELVINLKTARALRLDVPLQLQQLADEVIE
jgi:putative tryptophan/tyrosine transport system substrate-binding protein